MWFLFSLIAGLFSTGQGLIARHILKQKKDVWAFSFWFSFIGALVSFPFFISSMKTGNSVSSWILIIVIALLIVGHNLLNFKGSSLLQASFQGAISKFRLVFILVLSFFLLKEQATWLKFVGTMLTIAGGFLIFKKIRKEQSFKGIIFTLTATLFYATVIILYKFVLKEFNSQSLTFFIFLFPAVINLIIMPNSIQRVTSLIKSDLKGVVTSGVLGGFANLTLNHAYSIGEVSRISVIFEAFLIVTLIGEGILLKEKDHLKIKIVAVVLATLGAILIRI